VQSYRNDLMIYQYEKELFNERLDTNVNESQMRAYYESNKLNFTYKKNILRLVFVKVRDDEKLLKQFRALVRSAGAENKDELAALSRQYADNWFLDDEAWLDFDDIIKELPIKNYDEEQFIQNNKYFEIKEGHFVYLVNIKDYHLRNALSDYAFENENIRKIILNKRRIELLRKMEADLRSEAESKKDIENYTR
jgi:hypothetical protein